MGGHSFSRFLGAVGAIALFAGPALATEASEPAAQAPSATQENLALARDLIKAEELDARLEARLTNLASLVSSALNRRLAPTDPVAGAKIEQRVREAFALIPPRLVQVKARVLAANVSGSDLRAALVYAKSPTAQAVRAQNFKLQALASDLMGFATAKGAPADRARSDAYEAAPPATRALIDRIIAGEDVRGEVRRSLPAIRVALAAAVPSSKSPTTPSTDSAGHAADDRYVDGMVRVYERFFAGNFTPDQLAYIAEYIESDPFKATQATAPLSMAAVVQPFFEQMNLAMVTLDRTICPAIDCTAQQRSDLTAFLGQIRTKLSAIVAAIGQAS